MLCEFSKLNVLINVKACFKLAFYSNVTVEFHRYGGDRHVTVETH